jgi:hypothetical protein
MIEHLGIFSPAPIQVKYVDRAIKVAEQHYWEYYDATQPKFEPFNIRFMHNPNWRNEFFSVTCAADGNNTFWKVAHIVVDFASLSMAVI